MEKIKCKKCNAVAVWWYMSGSEEETENKDYYCDDCVPRGCSCNNESIYKEKNDTDEQFNNFCLSFKEEILKNNYILKDFGKKQKCYGEELETITDITIIREKIKNVSNEELQNYIFIPLDEKNRELPCCEYDYDKNGFEKEQN